MIRYLIPATLIVAGLIHLLPLPGVLGSERLTTLYGLSFSESNLAILMRHRAVLFGLLGVVLIVAAFRPMLRTLAFLAGLPVSFHFFGSLRQWETTTSRSREL
jgi:hypothetical protein